jgi:hypothetical protein
VRHSLRSLLALAFAALVVLAIPVAARADDDEDDNDDVRVERTCTGTSSVRLRVRTRDEDRIRVDLDVRTARRGARWTVVVVHERRLVLRTTRRTSKTSRAFAVRLTVPEWDGRNTVSTRAIGPRGEVCRAVATLTED